MSCKCVKWSCVSLIFKSCMYNYTLSVIYGYNKILLNHASAVFFKDNANHQLTSKNSNNMTCVFSFSLILHGRAVFSKTV